MKRYIRTSLDEQLEYARAWATYDAYNDYKNRSDMSISDIYDEICKSYSTRIADAVCEMIDIDRGTIADSYFSLNHDTQVDSQADLEDSPMYYYDYNVGAYKSCNNGKLLVPVFEDIVYFNDLESVADKVIEYFNIPNVDVVSVNGQVNFNTNKPLSRDEIISKITDTL